MEQVHEIAVEQAEAAALECGDAVECADCATVIDSDDGRELDGRLLCIGCYRASAPCPRGCPNKSAEGDCATGRYGKCRRGE